MWKRGGQSDRFKIGGLYTSTVKQDSTGGTGIAVAELICGGICSSGGGLGGLCDWRSSPSSSLSGGVVDVFTDNDEGGLENKF